MVPCQFSARKSGKEILCRIKMEIRVPNHSKATKEVRAILIKTTSVVAAILQGRAARAVRLVPILKTKAAELRVDASTKGEGFCLPLV